MKLYDFLNLSWKNLYVNRCKINESKSDWHQKTVCMRPINVAGALHRPKAISGYDNHLEPDRASIGSTVLGTGWESFILTLLRPL